MNVYEFKKNLALYIVHTISIGLTTIPSEIKYFSLLKTTDRQIDRRQQRMTTTFRLDKKQTQRQSFLFVDVMHVMGIEIHGSK